MAESAVRTRFAPSPTGELHLGNARAAILNWLFARHHGGAFVLRFEDTDVTRNVAGAEAKILESLDWLGLDRDEDPATGGAFGPYRQSERYAIYREHALGLVEEGLAFRCYCTEAELVERRSAAVTAGDPPGRDDRCRALTEEAAADLEGEGRTPALRLRVEPGRVGFRDRLKGDLAIDGADLGDMVLLRADDTPTYNFAVVVDDILMRISHVIRGVGHLSNTPKQVLLYRALGIEPPEFVHIPTVLAVGGGKLAKRAGAEGLLSYREQGYHPDAVVNYLSLLSWSSASGEEFLRIPELLAQIDLDRIGATDAVLDLEKMRWLSGQHVRAESPKRLASRLVPYVEPAGLGLDAADMQRSAEVIGHRIELLTQAADEIVGLFREPDRNTPEARSVLEAPDASLTMGVAHDAWTTSTWERRVLKKSLVAAGESAGVRGRSLFQPVRVALTGRLRGPELADVAYALGRERVLARLESAGAERKTDG
jgi:glutamyl-tRNA synthetase